MKNEFFFKNIDHSEAVISFTDEKIQKQHSLEKADIRWILSKEGEEFHARANLHIGSKIHSVESQSGDLYCAIDLCIHLLKRSSDKIKAKYKDFRKYKTTT